MKLLNAIANTRAILIIAVIEIVVFSVEHVLGSTTAKWHLLPWMVWAIFILGCRVAINGSFKTKQYGKFK